MTTLPERTEKKLGLVISCFAVPGEDPGPHRRFAGGPGSGPGQRGKKRQEYAR